MAYDSSSSSLQSQRLTLGSLGNRVAVAICVLLLTCAFSFGTASVALAEDIDTNPAADEFQQRVEQTAADYDAALAEVDKASVDLDATRARIAEIEAELPAQQKRSEAAAREMYKFQQERLGLLDLLLSSGDFYTFLLNLDYINRVTAVNVAEVTRLSDMKAELSAAETTLAEAKQAAEARADEAEKALVAAQEARLEAQRRAQEEARQRAEAAAAAAAAAASEEQKKAEEEKAESAKDEGSDDSGDSSGSEDSSSAPVSDDGANWSADEASFIAQWAPRIDAYLAGSPMAGTGTAFAQAAWEYGVDPRWSPAISFTESSCGRACFLPHNAWGWGSVSWDSWEEAINDHVRGLARGYGYTITPEAARKYCPPNADHWYSVTKAQMEMI